MDARRLLQRMCSRHGITLTDGSRLLPLVERALHSPDDVRNRILTMVDDNLARKADAGKQSSPMGSAGEDVDEEVLVSVARVLHNWAPSARVLDLGKLLPDLFPEGFDPGQLDE